MKTGSGPQDMQDMEKGMERGKENVEDMGKGGREGHGEGNGGWTEKSGGMVKGACRWFSVAHAPTQPRSSCVLARLSKFAW